MAEQRTTDMNFYDSPVAVEFMRSEAFVKGIMGPVGSGKSTACCAEIMRRALEMPKSRDGTRRSRFVAIRNSYRELLDTTLKTWLDWFPEDVFGPFNKNEMTHHIKFTTEIDGKVAHIAFDMLFRALDRPDDVKKLKSLELTGGWINEAVEIPVQVLQVLETRVGRYPSKWQCPNKKIRSFIILDTNPPNTKHWWYKLAEEFTPRLQELRNREYRSYRDALGEVMELSGGLIKFDHMSEEDAKDTFNRIINKYAFFRQPSGLSRNAENAQNLDPDYYVRAATGKDQEWVRVFVHGEYGNIFDGKPVYPEYQDSYHFHGKLLGPDKDNKRIIRGWDGGRTPACIFVQVSPRGQVMAFDELTSSDTGLSEFADIVKAHCAAHYPGYKFTDYGDPSIFFRSQLEDRSPAIILQAKGIELQPGKQSTTFRKESVKKILSGKDTFAIGPKCSMLREGLMGGYCFKRIQVSGERYHETPDKNEFSHPVEAFEYICTRLKQGNVWDEDLVYKKDVDGIDVEDDDNMDTRLAVGQSSVTGY